MPSSELTSCEGHYQVLGRKLSDGIPNVIGGDFILADPIYITGITRIPVYDLGGSLNIVNAHIPSFEGIGKVRFKRIAGIVMCNTATRTHILGLMIVKDLQSVVCTTDNKFARCTRDNKPFFIVDKHLHADRDMMDCKEELMLAGYKTYARL